MWVLRIERGENKNVLIEKGPPILSLEAKELEDRNDELDPDGC